MPSPAETQRIATFVNANVSPTIAVNQDLNDSVLMRFGTGQDITMGWDGTDFDILQATADSSFKWGIDGAGIDQVWYGDTASSNMTWDQSADALILTNSKISLLSGSGAAAAASGIVIGGGTSANPCTTAVVDGKFIEFRCETTAASGDNRLAYLRYAVGGAGGGECLRALTVLEAASGTCHGAHLGIFADDTGYITGSGIGLRGTLELGDAALPAGGTYYGGQVEIYSDGTSSSVAAVTKHAVLNIAATGNATGAATVLNALAIDGVTAADATKMISSVRLAELPAGSVAFAVLINGVRYYIPCILPSELN